MIVFNKKTQKLEGSGYRLKNEDLPFPETTKDVVLCIIFIIFIITFLIIKLC